jgi:hypothetical protein
VRGQRIATTDKQQAASAETKHKNKAPRYDFLRAARQAPLSSGLRPPVPAVAWSDLELGAWSDLGSWLVAHGLTGGEGRQGLVGLFVLTARAAGRRPPLFLVLPLRP